MLPFLDSKKAVTTIMAKRAGQPSLEKANEKQAPESDTSPGMLLAAEDLLAAIAAKSPDGVAKALQSAIEAHEGGSDEELPEPMADEGEGE